MLFLLFAIERVQTTGKAALAKVLTLDLFELGLEFVAEIAGGLRRGFVRKTRIAMRVAIAIGSVRAQQDISSRSLYRVRT